MSLRWDFLADFKCDFLNLLALYFVCLPIYCALCASATGLLLWGTWMCSGETHSTSTLAQTCASILPCVHQDGADAQTLWILVGP